MGSVAAVLVVTLMVVLFPVIVVGRSIAIMSANK